MRVTVLAVVTLAGLCAAVALGARALPGESWASSQFGWTADPPLRCKPRLDVCATEDGGASWHGIFRGGTFVFGVVRTSRTAGVVSTGRQVSARFWTRDNGLHWYLTRRVGPEFQGSGGYLFSIDFGPKLTRIRPWPPVAKARCKAVWTGGAFGTAPVKGGNVCSGPAVEAGMKATTVVTLEEGELGGLANVPGGVIATVTSAPVPRVLVYRLGRPRIVDLPTAGGLFPCTGFNREPVVTWPRLTVLACRQGGTGEQAGVWVSDSGGVTWRAISG
jgi:hypothetical protein